MFRVKCHQARRIKTASICRLNYPNRTSRQMQEGEGQQGQEVEEQAVVVVVEVLAKALEIMV